MRSGDGKFQVDGENLNLTFKSMKWRSSRCIKREERNLTTEKPYAYVQLKVFDGANNNTPFEHAYVILRGSVDNLAQFFTDSHGTTSFFIWDTSIVNSVSINCMGYEEISIPVDDMSNKSTVMACTLEPKEPLHSRESVKKYKIGDLNKNGFTLTNSEGVYLFKKDSK